MGQFQLNCGFADAMRERCGDSHRKWSEHLDGAKLIYSHADPIGMPLPSLAWPPDLFSSGALRAIRVDDRLSIDIDALRGTIAGDRAAGRRPFMLIATAGSASTGAIDDLAALADLAEEEDLWFHVDGAFGAMAQLAPSERKRIAGIARRCDQQVTGPVDYVRHRFRGISQQVENHLLKLNSITHDGRQIFLEIQAQHRAVSLQVAQRQRNHFARRLIQVQRLLGEFLPAE